MAKKQVLKEFLTLTVGTIIIGAAVYFFMVPSHLSVGSISGLAIVLSNFLPLQISAITLILNVVLLILGFLFIGREFGVKTVYTSILLPLTLAVFERLFPNIQSIMQDQFIDMICYIFIVDIGLALLFTTNASSGGLDIVAMFLNKYFRMELGKAMAFAGMVTAFSSALVYDARTVVLSLLGTYLCGMVLDYFIFGIHGKKRICILSEKQEEIRQFILNELHSGATIYEAIGAYDFSPRREIITIVNKSEYSRLMRFISETDDRAFVTVYTVSEVNYRPKPVKAKQ